MKVGMITTWNQVCGIASYAKFLVQALKESGHEVKVLAKTSSHASIVEEDEPFVLRVNKLDYLSEYLQDCDVVHMQYQNYLFGNVAHYLKHLNKPIVITFHDSCVRQDEVYYNAFVVHNSKSASLFCLGSKVGLIIRPGVPKIDSNIQCTCPNKLISFGLGRNMDDVVRKAIKETKRDIEFGISYGHHKWLSFDELYTLLASNGAIVLFYPPIDAFVSSLSARVAIGTKRPVIVSDTNWFEDLPGDVVFRTKQEDLKDVINHVFENYVNSTSNDLYSGWKKRVEEFITENSWLSSARHHTILYDTLTKNESQ